MQDTALAVLWVASVALALVALPLGYTALCIWMLARKAWWFTYLAYFFAFGSFGGWCLMLALAAMGPGVGALMVLGMEMFLLTSAMLACIVSFVVLQFRKQPDRFDRGAMLACAAYVTLHSTFFAWIILYNWSHA